MTRTFRANRQLIKKYQRQKLLTLICFAGAIIILSSLLTFVTMTIAQRQSQKPTVYEVKYMLSGDGSLDRFERLVSE